MNYDVYTRRELTIYETLEKIIYILETYWAITNRPFYSCVLSVLAWIESEAGVDLVLIETSLLFLCK